MAQNEDATSMSHIFTQGLEAKLGEDLAKHGSGIVTGFIGLVSYTDSEGTQNWSLVAGENQGILISMGMLDALAMLVDAQAQELLGIGED